MTFGSGALRRSRFGDGSPGAQGGADAAAAAAGAAESTSPRKLTFAPLPALEEVVSITLSGASTSSAPASGSPLAHKMSLALEPRKASCPSSLSTRSSMARPSIMSPGERTSMRPRPSCATSPRKPSALADVSPSSSSASTAASSSHSSEKGGSPSPAASSGKAKICAVARLMIGAKRLTPVGTKEYAFAGGLDMFDEGTMFLQEALTNFRLLRGAPPELVQALVLKAKRWEVEPGTVVLREEEICKRAIFALKGSLASSYGQAGEVSRVGPGQVIGEACLLGLEDRLRFSITAVAAPASPASPGSSPVGSPRLTGRHTLSRASSDHGLGGGQGMLLLATLSRDDFVSTISEHTAFREEVDELRRQCAVVMRDGVPVKSVHLFRGMADRTLDALQRTFATRLFFPGQSIITQGDTSDELYLIQFGRVRVQVDGRLLREVCCTGAINEDPICLGEVRLLGLQEERSATVIANTACVTQVLFRPLFMRILQATNDAMVLSVVEGFLTGHAANRMSPEESRSVLASIPLFRTAGCGPDFIDFLARRAETRVFLQDQVIINEDAHDTSMHVIVQGSARVLQNDTVVCECLSAGTVIGELVLLGISAKRTAGVVARELCLTQVLHQGTLLRGLEAFPAERNRIFEAVMVVARSKQGGGEEELASLADVADGDRSSVIDHVASAPFFDGLGTDFVELLSAAAVDRIFLPGELVIEQGQDGTSMFVIVSGQATILLSENPRQGNLSAAEALTAVSSSRKSAFLPPVDSNGRLHRAANLKMIKTIGPGAIVGELAMFGVVSRRMCHVQADSLTLTWEVSQDAVQSLLVEYTEAEERFRVNIARALRDSVGPTLHSLRIFADFVPKFKMLLALTCEARVFYLGEYLATVGRVVEGMYVITAGQATMEHHGKLLASFGPGSCFCTQVMLGVVRSSPASVRASTTVHAVIITHDRFSSALQTYPAQKEYAALAEREAQLAQELSSAIRRLDLQHRRQGGGMQAPTAHPFWEAVAETVGGPAAVRRAFWEWRALTRQALKRVRLQRRKRAFEAKWVKHRCDAVEERILQERRLAEEVPLRGGGALFCDHPSAASTGWLSGPSVPHTPLDEFAMPSMSRRQPWRRANTPPPPPLPPAPAAPAAALESSFGAPGLPKVQRKAFGGAYLVNQRPQARAVEPVVRSPPLPPLTARGPGALAAGSGGFLETFVRDYLTVDMQPNCLSAR